LGGRGAGVGRGGDGSAEEGESESSESGLHCSDWNGVKRLKRETLAKVRFVGWLDCLVGLNCCDDIPQWQGDLVVFIPRVHAMNHIS
jgi:hypothetical protein